MRTQKYADDFIRDHDTTRPDGDLWITVYNGSIYHGGDYEREKLAESNHDAIKRDVRSKVDYRFSYSDERGYRSEVRVRYASGKKTRHYDLAWQIMETLADPDLTGIYDEDHFYQSLYDEHTDELIGKIKKSDRFKASDRSDDALYSCVNQYYETYGDGDGSPFGDPSLIKDSDVDHAIESALSQ